MTYSHQFITSNLKAPHLTYLSHLMLCIDLIVLKVARQYGEMTEVSCLRRQGRAFYSAFIFGVSQATMYFCYALLFWYDTER